MCEWNGTFADIGAGSNLLISLRTDTDERAHNVLTGVAAIVQRRHATLVHVFTDKQPETHI